MRTPFDGMRPMNRAERRRIGITTAQYRWLVLNFFTGFTRGMGHA